MINELERVVERLLNRSQGVKGSGWVERLPVISGTFQLVTDAFEQVRCMHKVDLK